LEKPFSKRCTVDTLMNTLNKTHEFRGLDFIKNSAVPLHNTSPLIFGTDEENSFIASYKRLLEISGEKIPYWYLSAVSGAAFRLQIHCNSWRMNSPDILSGFSLTNFLFNAFSIDCECVWVCSDPQKIKIAREKIIDNIKRGIPSIGLSMDGKDFHGIVIGYTARDKLLAIDYSIPCMPHAVAEKLVWCYHIPTQKKQPLSKYEQFKQAFSLAEKLYTTERFQTYHLGFNAYDYWYDTLTNPSHHDPYKNDWLTIERNNGNHWIFVNLIDSKKAAAVFCENMANDFTEFYDELNILAQLYRNMIDILQPLIDKRVVRPNKDINPARPWTKHERRKQALKLMEVKELEHAALKFIQKINTTTI